MAMIENVTPILRVENLEKSERYYIKTLGFSLDWKTDGMISVSRNGKRTGPARHLDLDRRGRRRRPLHRVSGEGGSHP
jgi:catechol 2,3-dioxygenase-like lactoylglutathione lyase family enzyme